MRHTTLVYQSWDRQEICAIQFYSNINDQKSFLRYWTAQNNSEWCCGDDQKRIYKHLTEGHNSHFSLISTAQQGVCGTFSTCLKLIFKKCVRSVTQLFFYRLKHTRSLIIIKLLNFVKKPFNNMTYSATYSISYIVPHIAYYFLVLILHTHFSPLINYEKCVWSSDI